ncbi:LOW QUALITY PROTEIN: hypothetical protein ACHAW6_005358 [Cyclotella cf. meneghiniana]
MHLSTVPPHVYQRNAAEHAKQTFKDHFFATLASLPCPFPCDSWDFLLSQAELTLNLLCPSTSGPLQPGICSLAHSTLMQCPSARPAAESSFITKRQSANPGTSAPWRAFILDLPSTITVAIADSPKTPMLSSSLMLSASVTTSSQLRCLPSKTNCSMPTKPSTLPSAVPRLPQQLLKLRPSTP